MNAAMTEITDRTVSEVTDFMKELVDWFELPAKIQPRINENIQAFLKLELIAETIISLLYILTIVIIIKFVLEAVYESIAVCVFCSRRPRRLFPFGLANRSASIPFIARKDKKLKIDNV